MRALYASVKIFNASLVSQNMGGCTSKRQRVNGETDLYFAASYDLHTWIDSLMKEGADVNASILFGRCCQKTALSRAVAQENMAVVMALLRHGADVNAIVTCHHGVMAHIARRERITQYFPTAVHQATRQKSGKCLELLIKTGADVNIFPSRTLTPLMTAAGNNTIRCVKLLLTAGARVNFRGQFGCNAMQCHIVDLQTSRELNRELLTLLLAAGETTDKTFILDWNSYPPVHYAAPLWLIQLMKPDPSLVNICRTKIRKYLMELDNVNLFVRIPKLGLPPRLESLLLYKVSVEVEKNSCE